MISCIDGTSEMASNACFLLDEEGAKISTLFYENY
jgi:hypothetical protein